MTPPTSICPPEFLNPQGKTFAPHWKYLDDGRCEFRLFLAGIALAALTPTPEITGGCSWLLTRNSPKLSCLGLVRSYPLHQAAKEIPGHKNLGDVGERELSKRADILRESNISRQNGAFNGNIIYKWVISSAMSDYQRVFFTSSTAQGGGGSFQNRKPIGEVACCESGMAERIH